MAEQGGGGFEQEEVGNYCFKLFYKFQSIFSKVEEGLNRRRLENKVGEGLNRRRVEKDNNNNQHNMIIRAL